MFLSGVPSHINIQFKAPSSIREEGVLFIMGEAIITSRTGTIGSNTINSNELKTEIFKQSDAFIVPKARNQQFSVRIFGGGGGGSGSGYRGCSAGGGGGWMNNAILTINQGETIPITIGVGGAGGTIVNTNTADHKYSGAAGNTGGTTSFGTYLSAPGGTGARLDDSSPYVRAGAGGAGGGCESYIGAQGYQFGGGGGQSGGGNGGTWGGGGGCNTNGKSGSGGEYGGKGGDGKNNAENGTNTIGNAEASESLQGPGLAGINNNSSKYCGGGGYGGCGGYSRGGGGGYGANGGCYGGGGGGYGGKGGNSSGGGGSYGPGGSQSSGIIDGTFGGGGGGFCSIGRTGNGGDGICIIQYYPA